MYTIKIKQRAFMVYYFYLSFNPSAHLTGKLVDFIFFSLTMSKAI